MRYGSICSGVEAASLAWEYLGWEPVFFSEIEPFPSAVLAQRWPDVPNLGNFTQIKGDEYDGAIDLLVGGTPCQGFSVAGLRKGLADERSGLAIGFIELIDRLRPQWVVWENVPGVLSCWSGEPEDEEIEWTETADFDQFIAGIEKFGYGVAWRILDAQYVRVDGFGRAVPQRRRRVFAVGYFGDWRPAVAVLFERQCLSGNNPPIRQARQGTAGTIASCLRSGGDGGASRGENLVIAHGQANAEICKDQSPTLNCNHEVPILCVHGSQDPINNENCIGRNHGLENVVCYKNHPADSRIKEHGDLCPTIPARAGTGGGNLPLVAIHDKVTRNQGGGGTRDNDGAGNGLGISESGISYTLTSGDRHSVAYQSVVRRLTPLECERLMGFPDNHTRIEWRGKPEADCPDGHRYKACGNSMCVNVMRWIGKRIEMVENLIHKGI